MSYPNCYKPGDLLIGNNTKVIPARLSGLRDAVRIDVTLHRQLSLNEWLAFVRPAKRLKPGHVIIFADTFSAEVVEKREAGEVRLRFNQSGIQLYQALEQYGNMAVAAIYLTHRRPIRERS